MRVRSFIFTALFFVAAAGAQDLSNFDKILIPIVVSPSVEGANGDIFSSGVFALFPNSGVRVFPIYPTLGAAPEIGKPATAIPLTGLSRYLFNLSTPSRSGRLLFIERGASRQTTLYAKVDTMNPSVAGDVSSSVTQPIVREPDFKTDQIRIIGIGSRYVLGSGTCPNTATAVYRHTLRIYDVDGGQNTQVMVRRFDHAVSPAGEPILLSEDLVTIAYRDGVDPSYPSYAEMTIPEVCHPFSFHTPCTGGAQYVEITPVTPALRFWAMVSATNNVTHQVTLFHPQ